MLRDTLIAWLMLLGILSALAGCSAPNRPPADPVKKPCPCGKLCACGDSCGCRK